MPSDQKPPTYDANAKLCRAVKEYPCIYDRESPNYVKKEAYDAAWDAIANVCGETVASCKVRWRNIRTAFIRSVQGTPKMRLPNRTREYYLHEVLQFFLPHIASVETERVRESDEEVNSDKQKIPENIDGNISKEIVDKDLEETPKEEIITCAEPVEEHENIQTEKIPFKSKVKTFFIKQKPEKVESSLPEKTAEIKMDSSIHEGASQTSPNDSTELLINEMHLEGEEIESSLAETDKSIDDEGRFRFRRACKRGLDKTMVRELRLRKKDPEVKRQKRTIENRVKYSMKETITKKALDEKKHVGGGEEKNHRNDMTQTEKEALLPAGTIENQINTVAVSEKALEEILPNIFGNAIVNKPSEQQKGLQTTDIILNKVTNVANQSVQCKLTTTALDDDFLVSLKPHMADMNSRQKLHFKKKVYESIMEVFDNPTNFPQKGDETPLISDPTPVRIPTTSEELRLTRELVALVQAAKHTPEVHNRSSNVVAVPITNAIKGTSNQSAVTDSSTKKEASLNSSHHGSTLRSPSVGHTQSEIGMRHNLVRELIRLDDGNISPGGDRRRIYRIYPRTSLGATTPGVPNIPSSGVGTLVIPQTSTPAHTSTTSYGSSRNPQISNYISHSAVSVPSSVPLLSSEGSKAVNCISTSKSATGQRTMTIRSRIRTSPYGAPRQIVRRYSICGPPTTIVGQSISTATNNTTHSFPGTFIDPNAHPVLTPPTRRNNTSVLLQKPKVTSTVTTSTKTTPTASIRSTGISLSALNKYINSISSTNSLVASTQKTTPVPSTANISTSAEKTTTDKRLLKQQKPDTVEQDAQKVNTIPETAGIIASDNFATVNIKSEPVDETFL